MLRYVPRVIHFLPEDRIYITLWYLSLVLRQKTITFTDETIEFAAEFASKHILEVSLKLSSGFALKFVSIDLIR